MKILFAFFALSSLFAPLAVHAADDVFATGIVFTGIGSTCKDTGDCTLTDVMQVFVNVSNFVLGVVGSLVLVMFVYGGLRFLTSQGNPDGIKAGKQAMTGSAIGLLIVFGAFTLITVATGVLRGGTLGQQNKCELVSPDLGGKAGLGYACLKQTSDDNWDCIANLCPGGSDIQCCAAKTTTTTQ